MKTLLTGWFAFHDGEATAGDVLALNAVQEALEAERMPYDTAWSRGLAGAGVDIERVDPDAYTHLVFICGPVHSERILRLHRRFVRCRRVAVGVSVIDPTDPAVTGFHDVIVRGPDLSAAARPRPVPVAAVVLGHEQPEYGDRGRHREVTRTITEWLGGKECAVVPFDTRLDTGDWRMPGTPAQVESVLARMDVVITTRMHGLVLALKNGVPVLAVDPIAGGAKLTEQARVWHWPALLAGEDLRIGELDRGWQWCLSEEGRQEAGRGGRGGTTIADPSLAALLESLRS